MLRLVEKEDKSKFDLSKLSEKHRKEIQETYDLCNEANQYVNGLEMENESLIRENEKLKREIIELEKQLTNKQQIRRIK